MSKTISEIMRSRREAARITRGEVYRRGGPITIDQYDLEASNDIEVSVLIDWCRAIGCDPVEVFTEIVAERKEG